MIARADRWTERADEPCPACRHVYAYELEYRCMSCDGAVCAICAVFVRERHEVFCPECAPAESRERREA